MKTRLRVGRWVKTVWDEWQRMSGSNDPLRRHAFGSRDFDVNLDGVASQGADLEATASGSSP